MRRIRCPQCATINSAGLGIVGAYCENCGTYFLLEGKISEQPWASKGFFERMVDRFSSPKSITIGSVALLLLFVAFWGLLHLPLHEPAKPAVAVGAVDAENQTSGANEAPAPAAVAALVIPPIPSSSALQSAALPAALTNPVVGTRSVPHPLPPPVDSLSDEQLGEAIRRGAHYLVSQYDPATYLISGDSVSPRGENALCIYALLQCNDAITDPVLAPTSEFMSSAIEVLKAQPLDEHFETYGRSLRANALALIDRSGDRSVLASDVRWLQSAAREGAYTYAMPIADTARLAQLCDNSNSQYGLLGVCAGAESGMPVPDSYWTAVQNHWAGCQNADGSFGYKAGWPGNLSMTAAGVASLLIAHDRLAQSEAPGVDPRSPALIKALAWMNDGDHVLVQASYGRFRTSALYGVARAALASGCKYFGKHDWYTELALPQLRMQHADGAFGDPIDTAFTLLFLARGRHPILFNKLTIDGVVLDHPRDVVNLARYATRELEHTFNAQSVPIDADWTTWNDSPVLYLASATAPFVTDEQCDQLRNFVRAGGLLFTHANRNSRGFNRFAVKLAQRLFPDYPYQDLPSDHPLYSALFKINPPPPLQGVSNGARLLMVNSPRDLAESWDIHDWQNVEAAYHLGLNVFLYAAGKRNFRNRLDTSYLPAPAARADVTINVARLRYAGNWDPEPYAWTRFARVFQWKTSFAIAVHATDIADLRVDGTPIADLTGTDAHQFSPDEFAVLRKYVEQGGVLLIDSCGGAPGFALSQTAFLGALVPGAQPTPIPATHPLLNGSGICMDLLRQPVGRIAGETLQVPSMLSFGRGHVIVTPVDLTNALLQCGTLGIKGYQPGYAESLETNLLLWAYNGQPDQ